MRGLAAGLLLALLVAPPLLAQPAGAARVAARREAPHQRLLLPASAGVTNGANISQTAGDSIAPAVALDADGALHVAWEEEGAEIYAAQHTAGGWTSEPLVGGQSPAMASEPGGGPHLVYSADDGSGNLEIYHTAWTPSGWGAPANVSQTSGASLEPDVTTAAGVAHYAWTDLSPGDPIVYYGTPLGAGPVLDARGTLPALSVGPGGEPHLVWQEPDEDTALGEVFLIYASAGADRDWSFTHNLSVSPDAESHSPDVAVGPDGAAHVVWVEGDRIIVRSGEAPSLAAAIPLSAAPSANPRISADADGNVYAAWTEDARVRASVRWVGETIWQPPRTVADGLTNLGAVAVAAGTNQLHVAWSAAPTGDTDGDIFMATIGFGTERRAYLPLVALD